MAARADGRRRGTARARSPGPRSTARSMRPVGLATHYHANYVAALLGLEPGQDARRGRRTSSTAGRAAGAARRPSASAMPRAKPMRARCARRRSASSMSCPRRSPRRSEAAAIAALDEIDGRQGRPTTGERVAIRFNPKAREAVEKVKRRRPMSSASRRRTICAARSTAAAPTGVEAKPFGRAGRRRGQAGRAGQLTDDSAGCSARARERAISRLDDGKMARVTGLEPAASGVTGRRSNQLSYTRALVVGGQLGEPPRLSTSARGFFCEPVPAALQSSSFFVLADMGQRAVLEQEAGDVGRARGREDRS